MTNSHWVVGLAAVCLVVGCGSDKKKGSGDGGGGSSAWQAAVGDDGTFAQTFDGKTWTSRKLTDVNLYAVACVGNLDGWAAGENGYVARTKDGGGSWQVQDAHTQSTLRAIHFVADHRNPTDVRFVGVAAGDAGTLVVSTQGGEPWSVAQSGTTSTLRGVSSALDATLLLVAGDGGTVLRSSDTGVTWERVLIGGAGDLTGIEIQPNGGLTLAVDQSGGIWASVDLGKTFSLEAQAGEALYAVALDPAGEYALAVGEAGTALRRDASGAWTKLSPGTSASLRAALILDDGTRQYAAGSSGTLLVSYDQARTMSPLETGLTATLRGLEDLDPH